MDYWVRFDSVWFLFALAIFPRLSLLFSSIASGGVLWCLGWFFTPHLLIAVLAVPYFDENPILCVIAWMIAFAGTLSEGKAASKTVKVTHRDGRVSYE